MTPSEEKEFKAWRKKVDTYLSLLMTPKKREVKKSTRQEKIEKIKAEIKNRN